MAEANTVTEVKIVILEANKIKVFQTFRNKVGKIFEIFNPPNITTKKI